MKIIKRQPQRFRNAFAGILHALRNDVAFMTQVYGGLIAIIIFVYVCKPLTHTESLFLGLAYALILITELQNSSFEMALDRLHPERHEEIGKSKDMAAGSVLLSGFFLVFVMVVIALN